MQQLIYFIRKFKYFLLFILLETIAFIFIIQHHSFHKSKFINSANAITGGIYNSVSSVNDFFHLKSENHRLIKENTLLRNLLNKSELKLNKDTFILNDSAKYGQKYKYSFGKIINNNYTKRNNTLTLNKGTNQGMTADLGVINSKGIIGVTKSTSNNYTTVLSILNKNSNINVRLKNSNHYGTLVWNGNNWIISSGSNPPPSTVNANFYWWQDFDSTSNSFTTDIYCVENCSGGIGPFSYNWVFGDGNTSSIQYPVHVYNQVGDYNLCLTYTDANGYSSNYCDTVTISSRNGFTLNVIDESQVASLVIDNKEILTNSKIYPNPIGEQSFIEINSTQNLNANISYLDYSGKIIKSQDVSLINGFNKIKINALDMSSGIYFIKISNDVQNLNKTMKFIK